MRNRTPNSHNNISIDDPIDDKSSSTIKLNLSVLVALVACIGLVVFIYDIPSSFGGELSNAIIAPAKSLIEMTKNTFNRYLQKPIPYCNTISVDAYNNESNIIYYNNFPSNITIHQLIQKRIQPAHTIPMCPHSNIKNYNQYQTILAKLPNNLIPYTHRCQINAINRGKRQFGGLLSGDPLKPHHSTQIGFLHVYKAGGTTVRDTMNHILPGQSRVTWNKYRGHLRQFMSHLFMFSHVRDPITRVISSFFELHRRNETEISMNSLIGIESFRYMLQLMKTRMHCALSNKTKQQKMKDNIIGSIYFNMHIMPQMYFLTEHGNPWKQWPINYVGNMSELNQSVFEILYRFYWNTTDYLGVERVKKVISREDALEIYNKNYHHGRNRHNKKYLDGGERRAVIKGETVLKYQIERSDLSDDDIKKICDIYWMDYICIPFPLPSACNLTELLLRHYGDDVVYKECWEYNTESWDRSFVNNYKTPGWDPIEHNPAAKQWLRHNK